MNEQPIPLRSVECGCSHEHAANDPDRRLSTHRTSQGHVVCYRCYCGTTQVVLHRWTAGVRDAS